MPDRIVILYIRIDRIHFLFSVPVSGVPFRTAGSRPALTPEWIIISVISCIHIQSQCHLLEVAQTGDAPRLLPRRIQRRKKKTCKDGDDRYYNKEFYQSKYPLSLSHSFSPFLFHCHFLPALYYNRKSLPRQEIKSRKKLFSLLIFMIINLLYPYNMNQLNKNHNNQF